MIVAWRQSTNELMLISIPRRVPQFANLQIPWEHLIHVLQFI